MSKYIFATSAGVYATDGTAAGTTLLQATGADFVPQPDTPMVTLPNGEVPTRPKDRATGSPKRKTAARQLMMLWTAPTLRHRCAKGWLR